MEYCCPVRCWVVLGSSSCALGDCHTLSLLRLFSLLLLGTLLRCLSSQLECMYSAFGRQLFLQQSVDHPVSCGLRLSLECVRHNDKPEMGFGRGVALHCLVVGVHVGVVVNLKAARTEGLCDLHAVNKYCHCV